jgi:hypothetical protein
MTEHRSAVGTMGLSGTGSRHPFAKAQAARDQAEPQPHRSPTARIAQRIRRRVQGAALQRRPKSHNRALLISASSLWMSMTLCPQGLMPWSTVASGTRSRSRLAEASGPGSSTHHLSRDRGRSKGLVALQFSQPRRRSIGGGNNGTDSMPLGSFQATDDRHLCPNSPPAPSSRRRRLAACCPAHGGP